MQKYEILKTDYLTWKHPRKGLPVKLYRIVALKTFSCLGMTIKEGEIGGYIQNEKNLSQEDNSWVAQTAKVFDNVTLLNSYVTNDAQVFENSTLENVKVTDKVRIFGTNKIVNAEIYNNVDVENAEIHNSILRNWSVACNKAVLNGVEMSGGSRISDSNVTNSQLTEQAEVKSKSQILNCNFGGRTVISNKKLENQTLSETIELNVLTNAS